MGARGFDSAGASGDLSVVQSILIYQTSLTGPIPPELGNLSHLTALGLPENSLTGPIPPELGNLSRLAYLTLDRNSLTGSIPPELGDLSDLATLDLRNNSLTGCIPAGLQRFVSTINPQNNGVNLPVCPGVPALTLVAGDGEITASWTVPAGRTPTGYDLEYKLASASEWTDAGHTGTDTTFTIGSLTNGSEYSVQVRARTADAAGPWSEVATATPEEPMTAPTFGDATVADQSYVLGLAIATLTLPEATGGNGDLVYTLTPDPPAGLTFDGAERTLKGTPTALQGATTYTYTVIDSDADSTASDAGSLTFRITVSRVCEGSTAVGGRRAAGWWTTARRCWPRRRRWWALGPRNSTGTGAWR